MPRKGTETIPSLENRPEIIYLEMRCPGRGRKPITPLGVDLLEMHLEMRCPGRGRKRILEFWKPYGNYNLEMRCPGRGRKPHDPNRCSVESHLEMRCPGRGRKPLSSLRDKSMWDSFGNEMPRKGTETTFRSDILTSHF